MITLSEIECNEEIRTYIQAGNDCLGTLGYTEHNFAHATKVSRTAGRLCRDLGYDERTCELASIAGFMHDIGNAINRIDHAQSGAVMAFTLLHDLHMPAAEIATVTAAIGNHDEGVGSAISTVAAALILADKSDVRRSRVRPEAKISDDIHDRVNYAVTNAHIQVSEDKESIVLSLTIDQEVCPMIEYFEIFLDRMLMCRSACEFLKVKFQLIINGTKYF